MSTLHTMTVACPLAAYGGSISPWDHPLNTSDNLPLAVVADNAVSPEINQNKHDKSINWPSQVVQYHNTLTVSLRLSCPSFVEPMTLRKTLTGDCLPASDSLPTAKPRKLSMHKRFNDFVFKELCKKSQVASRKWVSNGRP